MDYGDSNTNTNPSINIDDTIHNATSTSIIANTTSNPIANATTTTTTVADNDTQDTFGAGLRTIPSSFETLLNATSQLRRLLMMISLRAPSHSVVEDENGSFQLGKPDHNKLQGAARSIVS